MPQLRRSSRLVSKSEDLDSEKPPAKKRKLSQTKEPAVDDDAAGPRQASEGLRKQRASKPKKEADVQTFLPRVNSPWKVGAHVSSAGGVENTVINAAMIGANAFALFLKSQRKWTSPPLSEDSIKSFKERMIEHKYTADVVLPHGSYLINLGNPDADKREKSYECFIDDLKRCELLGLKYYNFHPGSTVGNATKEESITLIAQCLNRAHRETKYVVTVLENMAGAGNIIGGDFAHLKSIIDGVEDKTRVGVCLDTCHSFAAGYDLRSENAWDELLKQFDETVGLSYLCGMHLNDSKTDLGSKRDRHESIGLGYLGIGAFRNLMNDPRVQNIPLILETPTFEQPIDTWGKEIAMLQKLSLAVSEIPENNSALESIIGDAQTEDQLVAMHKNVVEHCQVSKNKTAKRKSGKKSRNEGTNKDEGEDE
ncbi:hypothetical protein AGABI2DRAFT_114752 [Agaricus bisporus var. bisporus H97]|uniref:hypothetical protein n=1 Tax=Agaricus bisporus var. bisporus (strain H97 / ATCC MYA-4626 / FGSC 10389) TaxID=936046 RepID=UPI00029F59BF|nr:hypothetical protein AGABI2DRAFT_114752 [Agaricus bisporus var. bisporus H97]EKV49657.1 hypothetical protein AGABI2DRAFT_114752 [Agaricus bisporus var. bisporus H97]